MSTTVGDVTSRTAIDSLFHVSAARVPLSLVPPFGGSASLRWSEPAGRLWAEAGTRFSWRYDRLPPPTPNVEELSTPKAKWLVADLAAGVRLETGQRLELGVRNLLDQRYRPALASIVDPGRTFFTSISSNF
jgi:outer membrane receptor protein involved in Fe transport